MPSVCLNKEQWWNDDDQMWFLSEEWRHDDVVLLQFDKGILT